MGGRSTRCTPAAVQSPCSGASAAASPASPASSKIAVAGPGPARTSPGAGAGAGTSAGASAGAEDGMGPLLYDVAIELASQMGGGLMSGRYSVTGEAAAVWDKYDERGDVDSEQLDIELGFRSNPHALAQLTPDDDTDDCIQDSAVNYGHETDDRDPWSWSDRSLSRIFRKRRTPVMDELRKRGLLVIMKNGKAQKS